MSGHLTSYYTAIQIDRESLEERAAKGWAASTSLPGSDRLRSTKTLVVALAVAVIGFGGAAATLAQDFSSLPDGVIAERAAEGSGEMVPARPWDGRPW